MPDSTRRASKRAHLPPGTLVHVGEKMAEHVRIRLVDYDENNLVEKELVNVEECYSCKDQPTVTWINIDGLHQVDVMENIGKHYGVHPLILEDILHTGQRPKMDDLEDYVFIVTQMLSLEDGGDDITAEQFSLILGKNYVLTFQEKEGDVFEHIRERIRKNKGRLRKMGADYLAYALLDAIVDNYFILLEKIGERIESLEEELIQRPRPATLHTIHHLKSDLIFLRKSVWPLREIISMLERGESNLFMDKTIIYLKDLYDHTIQVMDTIETFRDMVSGMLDVYLSSISNRLNEVMKVLTIISTIFIPLTFLVGVYGMNFKFMPELEWRWGYPLLWVVMIAVGIGMLFYFRKKRWL